MKAHFEADCGAITDIRWVEDRDTGRFKGMAVVEFADAGAAQKAVNTKNATELLGRTMYCRYDQPKGGGGGDAASASKESGLRKPPRERSAKPAGCKKLYCGNLSYDIDDAGLRDFFDPLPVARIRWVTDRASGEFKGCGFVEFDSTEDADAAIDKHGTTLLGRSIRLDWAEDRPRPSSE
mmetsp:Transcript_25861/g.103337  ORF Transcript_25861/g.103337 Transcript_25861/m.103337 type:complete len:180 (+) Transcript_25861:1127-1666(+)